MHVSAGVFGHFVGARAADPANRRELASYWLASAYVNWQPLEKHLSLTLSADNIFNESYERSAGFPGVGPSLVLSAEYRF